MSDEHPEEEGALQFCSERGVPEIVRIIGSESLSLGAPFRFADRIWRTGRGKPCLI